MNIREALSELKDLYGRRESLEQSEVSAWLDRASEILHSLSPARAYEFDKAALLLDIGLSDYSTGAAWRSALNALRGAIAEAERITQEPAAAHSSEEVHEKEGRANARDPRDVFVVHGRNGGLRDDLFEFLRHIGLNPIEWSAALALTGKASPYVGEVLDAAFEAAQSILVLLSPDDEVRLRQSLWRPDDGEGETSVRVQARPNVLFEAGLAFGRDDRRTLLVEVGEVKPFSDIGGRHVVRLNNSRERRTELAHRLRNAGCPVDLSGEEWLIVGNFEADGAEVDKWPSSSAGSSPSPGLEPGEPALEIRMGHLGAWREEQILVKNVGSGVAEGIEVFADGSPIDQHKVWVGGQTLPERLRPGEEFGVKIALARGCPERADIRVTFKDEGGRDLRAEHMVQLI